MSPRRNNINGQAFNYPEERVAYYGTLVAPLTRALPPMQVGGRQDVIAKVARGMAGRKQQKNLTDAQEKLAKGERKDMDSLENGLKWVGPVMLSLHQLCFSDTSSSLL